MEATSEGENNRNNSDSPIDGPKKPKRQMKTPYQLEILEKTYAAETYPTEATRVELSEKLGLSDRQLQMWFCHRRLKDKKDIGVVKKQRASEAVVGTRGLSDSGRDELGVAERGSDEHGSKSGSGTGSGSGSGTGSGSSYGDDLTMVRRYYESPRSVMERRVIACVEAQLGEPLREDGPCLGLEFDELPPDAFGAPIVTMKQRDQSGFSYEGKSFEQRHFKPIKAAMRGHRECLLDEPIIRPDAYGRLTASNLYDSPVECHNADASLLLHGNGRLSRGYGVQGQVSGLSLSSQQGKQGYFSSPSGDNNCVAQKESLRNVQMDALDIAHPAIRPENKDASDTPMSNNEYVLQMEKKRKSDEARNGRQGEAHEKKIRKELEKQDILRRKREEQMRKEMEKHDRERRKEEERMLREKQRLQERLQREERREIERREKFLQRESLRVERRRQKEELRREKEEVRLKAALERATARRIARESMELIEDERLELMELAASSKGLPSLISLDHDTLQNLESFRDLLCSFPPKSVQLKRPFAIQPWTDSDENIGNLLMVWRFCITFADVLGLWPSTLDEFVQAFHDFDSRLLGEIHVALLKLIIKDIEDVARTPSTGLGTNQFSSANPEGGHPQIVEGAYLWGFDIRNWKDYLNPLTWPEILRQFALSAGFGPQLKKKNTERACLPENDETKGCEDIVSVLRNGSAAENAVAIMQEKGLPFQRRSRHRLTPGTVKFAAYHVLSLEGNKGLTVLELAHKIQKSGLRDLTTSKTPEASISVALSRDAILFERTAPSTYRVRPPFRKDPADAEAILSAAREKIKRYENGFLAGENADDVERDEDSEADGAEGPEVHDLGTPNANKNSNNIYEASTCSGNAKENFFDDVTLNLQNEPDTASTPVNQVIDVSGKDNGATNPDQGDSEIDESRSGELWVQGLSEGEYSDLSVEERLNALVALVSIANEGNAIRVVLEDRLDAANALKKQMWAEAQLDKKRFKEENMPKFHSSLIGNEAEIKQTCAVAESSQSPLVAVGNKIYESPLNTSVKKEPLIGADDVQDQLNSVPPDRILVEPDSSVGQISSAVQQNAYAAERSRLQLKTYIGHRAEEMYVYRSLPLGQDRRRNRYWRFVASASRHDPGSGRIFVESPDGYWRLIDSEEAFDVLLASLDTRGIRESHLHIMLQNIEESFRENVRRNSQCCSVMDASGNVGNQATEKDSSPAQSGGADSPSSTVSGSNSNTCEPSLSFRIELGRNENDKKAAMERYQEFQMWMWRECFNSSTLHAMRHGEKRCRPVLGICDFCLDSYVVENDLCPSCFRSFGTFDNNTTPAEIHFVERRKLSPKNSKISKFSHPLRIRLLKALLAAIEASVPSEALKSSWMENCRKMWGIKLHASLSAEDLLQILTKFEAVIKRGWLSINFETTEELLASSALSGRGLCDSACPGSVPQLPWIPVTTAAVALRLLEFDGSISYTVHQKAELLDNMEVEDFTKRYALMKNIEEIGQPEMDQVKRGKRKNGTDLACMHGSSGYRQGVRGRVRGRPQKRAAGSGRRNLKDAETSNQVLVQQGERTDGQRLGWGRRTVRRKIEKKAVQEPRLGRLGNMGGLKNSWESLRNSNWEHVSSEIQQMQTEDADNGSSSESVESDDNDCAEGYEYGKLGLGNSTVMSDEDVDGSEDDNDFDEMGEENFLVNVVDTNEDIDGNVDGDENLDESTDSADSEDYSE